MERFFFLSDEAKEEILNFRIDCNWTNHVVEIFCRCASFFNNCERKNNPKIIFECGSSLRNGILFSPRIHKFARVSMVRANFPSEEDKGELFFSQIKK